MTDVKNNLKEKLTVSKRSEQHPETAETACLIGPHPHYSHASVQHDVISYCTTKLGLQETAHHFLLSCWMCSLTDAKVCRTVATYLRFTYSD